jgi:hypothetical protein
LELPIDHFRLLGVNPATDAQTVLHTLQLRLDRPPAQGFTADTLEARAELLRASADLLSDSQRRDEYEATLTSLAAQETGALAALEIPSSRDLGGLLLLLEAGLATECFELVRRQLQPPQAPTLGSGREADLSLLAGLACLATAADLHQQRRYETAAQTLVQGLQVLQRTGQQPQLRQQLQDELDGLQPFRVLDLISRDLAATAERGEGLALLDALVQRRGGLEGEGDPRLPADDFMAFFRQIRSFLTVQEQVDLFSRWGAHSSAAHFLATTALTAAGFARRKPEQIAAALARLQGSGQTGTEPLQACLHLLLGKVDAALELFASGASPELRQWAAQQSDDPLAQICAYCRDWLGRDVLPGYRDLEADPDLEAWFADRDVLAYVDQHERPDSGRAEPASGASSGSGFLGGWQPLDWGAPLPPEQRLEPLAGSDSSVADAAMAATIDHDSPENETDALNPAGWLGAQVRGWRARLSPARLALPRLPRLPLRLPELQGSRRHWLGAAAAAAALAAAGAGALLLRGRPTPPTPIPVQSSTPAAAPTPSPAPKPPPAAPKAAAPLTAAEPSEAELQALLDAWLAGKAAVLAGRESAIPLTAMARGNQVERLQEERRSDAAEGGSQRITTTIRSLSIEERSPRRIAALVTLDYSDQRLDGGGEPVGQPTTLKLRNRYVFARDNDRWLLASFQPAD